MPRRITKSPNYSQLFNNLIDICEENNTCITALLDEFMSSKSAMQAWKNGNINTNIILKLAHKFNVSLDYLFTGKENPPSELSDDERKLLEYFKELPHDQQQRLISVIRYLAEQDRKEKDKEIFQSQPTSRNIIMTSIKRYRYPSGAGTNVPPDIADEYDLINIPYDKVPLHADSLIRISGDSMEPDYPNKCWVWVNTDIHGSIIDYFGKTIIANNHGELLLKIAESDGLHSINNRKYPVINADEDCKIIGLVIDIVSDELIDFIKNAKELETLK